ncbi:MAG: hypothetical protein M9938_05410 [Solirubrobacterales bacterium]|nr:hypothetical protein [Solirubrobacterales bacterium]
MAENRDKAGSAGWASWVAFVAVMMILIGIFSVIAGLAAVTDDGFITRSTGDGSIFLLSSHAIGVLWIVVGALIVCTGWALIQGREWARIVTIILAGLHAVVDLLTVSAHPFLSLLFILISLTIIYGVTVKWEQAKIGMGD